LNAARHLITPPIGRKFLQARGGVVFPPLCVLITSYAFLFTGGLSAVHRLIVTAAVDQLYLGLGRDASHQL